MSDKVEKKVKSVTGLMVGGIGAATLAATVAVTSLQETTTQATDTQAQPNFSSLYGGKNIILGSDDPAYVTSGTKELLQTTIDDDYVLGGKGQEIMYSSYGADDYDGDNTLDASGQLVTAAKDGRGTYFDAVSYRYAPSEVGLDLSNPSRNTGTHAEGDTFKGIEVYELSDFNDTFKGTVSNDRVLGRAGIDTAFYNYAFSDYTVTVNGNATTVTGPEGADTYTDFEKFKFADGMYTVGTGFKTAYILGTDEFKDTIATTPEDDIVLAGKQNDTIAGSEGCDDIRADDMLDATGAMKTLANDPTRGQYFDTMDYRAQPDQLVFNPNNPSQNKGLYAKCDTLKGIERIFGASTAQNVFFAGKENMMYVGGKNQVDAAIFSGNKDDYMIAVDATMVTTVKPKAGVSFVEGETKLHGIERMIFNDGIIYANGEFQKYAPTVEIDSASIPPDALGVAVYYGQNLDQKFATANGMKRIVDERMSGAVLPPVGDASSVLGAGTAVKVFTRGELTSTFSYTLPINGTIKDPVGVMVMAIMPVGTDQQNKPYQERTAVASTDRYKTEFLYDAFVTPVHFFDESFLKHGQETACYANKRYPDQYSAYKSSAKLNANQVAFESVLVNPVSCGQYEDENNAYIANPNLP